MNCLDFLSSDFGIDNKILDICTKIEEEISAVLQEIDNNAEFNQLKVLKAMQKNGLSSTHFQYINGYGYDDPGREVLEDIYSDVFHTNLSLVRPQIISGTHALTIALFGNLRYGDELLSPVGKPYDTLEGVIGIRETKGSLKEHGIVYKQVDLLEDDTFDYKSIEKAITNKTKMLTIQRSKGYAWRKSFSIEEIKELILFVKNIRKDIICMVDNCYGEFVEVLEPSDVGADLTVGSLIKNPGGGLAPVGGYITGKAEYVENAAYRLTSPGLGREVGPTLGICTNLLQGLFFAPTVVAASLKSAVFASAIFDYLGFDTLPKPRDKRSDIVQAIKFLDSNKLISFCKGVQMGAPVDSHVLPEPAPMPGYDSQVIMAAGAFVQGSSIEFSADGPLREPYIAFLQGGLTWAQAKAGVIIATNKMYMDGYLKI